jgi:hypothetical protein
MRLRVREGGNLEPRQRAVFLRFAIVMRLEK